jgi:type IV secretory pathway VirB3-like protein
MHGVSEFYASLSLGHASFALINHVFDIVVFLVCVSALMLGMIVSLDDFYIMSSGIVMIQTTNNVCRERVVWWGACMRVSVGVDGVSGSGE